MSVNQPKKYLTSGGESWLAVWPENELEVMSVCPVCGSAERTILHEELMDNVSQCAPGKWNSWLCAGCQCLYLDPRPSRESIHLAYRNYHTHQQSIPKQNYSNLSPFRKLRRNLVNGYINWRYSSSKTPATPLGVPVFLFLWPLKQILDREYRHLPRIPKSGGALLDVGCGNCSFLEVAKSCGWDVVGVDPDIQAITHGRNIGLHVMHGDINKFNGQSNLFDVITLNHVIEHVHDPLFVLKTCHRLLKIGGKLWLETPNIDSFGHRFYMKDWRGLEPPRHLVLFNLSSLSKLLADAGFSKICTESGSHSLLYMTKASEAIKRRLPIGINAKLTGIQNAMVIKNKLLELFVPSRKELLTISAYK